MSKCTKCDKELSDFDITARGLVTGNIDMTEEIKKKWNSTAGMCLKCSYKELRPLFLDLSGDAGFVITNLDPIIMGDEL